MSALPWFGSMATASVSASASVHDIDQALRKRKLWNVALPQPLERAYQRDALEGRLMLLQSSGWLALLIFDCFLLVDWLMANDVFVQSMIIRLAVFTPFGVTILLLARHYGQTWVQRQFNEVADLFVMVSGGAAGICLAVILLQSHSPLAMYYHAGYMVVIIYGILVQPLGFRWAVVYGLGMLLLHMWSAQQGQAMPEPLRLSLLHLMVCTVALALAANHMVERARRRSYLLLMREKCLVDQLEGVNTRLQQLSRSDVLTGVANRRHFHGHLQQVWQRAAHDQTPVSVLMLDVDHFKAYNDRHGHPAGDACLRQVAQAMAQSLRQPVDFIARYGGEEFVAILPGADEQVALQVAERVRQGVQACAIEHLGSSTAPVVTASIGVATAVPGSASGTPGQSADKLVACADRALYEAKRATRNCVRLYGAGDGKG
jgi:diguanylate cyclase (GGDEF)-like protein